jgi:hypothetical protein
MFLFAHESPVVDVSRMARNAISDIYPTTHSFHSDGCNDVATIGTQGFRRPWLNLATVHTTITTS